MPIVSEAGPQASGGFDPDLVWEAPQPVLVRLDRPDDRMLRRLEVGGGVAVWTLVATSDATAGHALSQVQPPAADPQALLAAVRGDDLGRIERLDKMLTTVHKRSVPPGENDRPMAAMVIDHARPVD